MAGRDDVTQILNAAVQGDRHAAQQILPLVYDELRKLATQRMASEAPGHTLQATALVHDAYLRLVDVDVPQRWNGRGHFFAAAAEAMRRILIENARRKARVKHGGGLERIDLDADDLATQAAPDALLVIDDAITALAAEDPDAAQLVKLRYFAGLSVEQAAEVMGVSRSTAYERWSYARAWLLCQFQGRPDRPTP